MAAAVGGFALAVAGFLHPHPGMVRTWLWALALIVWPAAAGIPAFLVSFVIALVLRRAMPHA